MGSILSDLRSSPAPRSGGTDAVFRENDLTSYIAAEILEREKMEILERKTVEKENDPANYTAAEILERKKMEILKRKTMEKETKISAEDLEDDDSEIPPDYTLEEYSDYVAGFLILLAHAMGRGRGRGRGRGHGRRRGRGR